MRLLRRPALAGAVALALVATMAACGDDDGDSGTRSARIAFTYEVPAAGVDPAVLEAAITERLDSIGIIIEGIDVGTPGEVEVALEDDRLVELSTDLLSQQGVLRFRPLLSFAEGERPDLPLTPAAQDLADQEVTLGQQAEDGTVVGTYRLGPAVVDATGVESATAREHEAGFVEIQVVLLPAALGELNDAASLCFARAVTCPSAQLAITVDGVVVAAPEVAQPSFERDEIAVAPELDDVGTRRLATVLDTGPLPVALTPVET